MAGVVLASRFVFSQKKYNNYINYIDRSEAIRNEAFASYSAYVNDYMDNPQKQRLQFNANSERASALFTATKDQLNADEKKKLKEQFIKSQKADSPMWQNVLSFENEFLEQHGIYDSKTKMLDEAKMRNLTRLAMKEMLRDEGMDASAVWSASIHYNTDNIHIHMAVVEPVPTRKRKEYIVENENGEQEKQMQFKGGLKKGTLLKMKSVVANNIIDRSEQLKEINDIIRKNIVADKKDNLSYADRQLKGAFLNIYYKLPNDERLWFYNMNALHDIRPEIDRFTKMYIDRYHKDDFARLNQKLQEQQEFLKSVYGEGKKNLNEQYAETKISDLYTRMGNAVLRELRQYDKLQRAEQSIGKRRGRPIDKLREKKSYASLRSNGVYMLRKALKKDFTAIKNQMEFENLQREIERSESDYER